MNALQLLVYQAPLSSIMLFFIIPFFEPMSGNLALFDSKRELVEWFFIILSGINAFVINLSTYWVIGNTSALTYNMLGNLKFIATIIIGHVIFKESFSGQQIAAVFTVLVGITLYTYFKIKEAEDKKSLLSLLSTSSLSESKS
jgi:solute carrier family 35 protein E3